MKEGGNRTTDPKYDGRARFVVRGDLVPEPEVQRGAEPVLVPNDAGLPVPREREKMAHQANDRVGNVGCRGQGR